MVELSGPRSKARFDVSKRLAIGQLRKEHHQELVPAGKVSDTSVAIVALDTLVELVAGKQVEQLSENEASGVHARQHRWPSRPGNPAETAGGS